MSRQKKAKKTGPTGGFGVRYGVRSRRRYRDIMTEKKKKHTCPQCSSSSVKRESVGIWLCSSCGHKFSGGAYIPFTKLGETARRSAKTG